MSLDLRLEDERFWALVFASGCLVIAVVVFVDSTNSPLLIVATVATAMLGYLARAAVPRVPSWVVMVGAIAALLVDATGTASSGTYFFVVLAAFYVPFRDPSTVVVMVSVVAAIAAPLILEASNSGAGDFWLYWATAFVLCGIFGRIAFQTRRLVLELERTRVQITNQAVAEERARIALDVHDIVGHSLSAILLHIGGARRLVNTNPQEAETVLVQAENVGRRSMVDVRRAVALLRGGRAPDSATPGISDIEELVREHRQRGLDVRLTMDESVETLSVRVGLTSYRIVAEALTNASKHSGGATVDVLITRDESNAYIRVVNHGGHMPSKRRGVGFGLEGMAERARSVGGHLDAGPTADGWMVEATLPRTPTAQSAEGGKT